MSTKPTDVWTDRSRRSSWRCPTCRNWVRCEIAIRCTKCAKALSRTAPVPEPEVIAPAVEEPAVTAVPAPAVDPYAPTWTRQPDPEPEPEIDPYAPTWTRVPDPEDAAA